MSQRIDGLGSNLSPKVRDQRICEIRRQAEQTSQPIQVEMAQRANQARQQLNQHTGNKKSASFIRSLNTIDVLAAQASLALTEALTGYSNPIERLKVGHRMAALG